jgi:Cu+-exporting ATPase
MKMNRIALTFAVAAAALAPFAVRAQDAPKTADAAKADAPPTLCVVRGDLIKDPAKAAGKTEIGGKTYYICCKGCVAKMDSSDAAAKTKMAKVTDLKTEKLVLEKRLEKLNKELSDIEGKPAATKAAAATASVVYCAVTDEEIGAPDKAAATLTHNGKTYYVCCPGCKPAFEKDPAKFAAAADKKAADRAAKK